MLPTEVNVQLTVTKGEKLFASTYTPNDKSGFIPFGILEGTYTMNFEPPLVDEGVDKSTY